MHFNTLFAATLFLCTSFAVPSSLDYDDDDLYVREFETESTSDSILARTAEPDPNPQKSVVPEEWLRRRDPLGTMHLGDDGVLRLLSVRVPDLVQRDEHLEASFEVIDARALSPDQIAQFNKRFTHPLDVRHLEVEFEGIDGRDVHPRDHFEPHPKMLPRSPGTMAELRALKEREIFEEMNPLLKRDDQDCTGKCRTDNECYKRAGSNADATFCKCSSSDARSTTCYVDGGPNGYRPSRRPSRSGHRQMRYS